ncbi:helix-turn-helix domain-containing protein [Ahrensia sp. R2A130]|uniref:helix-turn-helix domain-containing protein n=1 Tax=Ahrensia sp. R2A130 TaxID=744979 RepID=UPI0001E0B4A1|nr:helix-turn-helix domain-containing protein [Ahrensia sp. R2A130]EFL89726.1 XRE family transcriptional regulator [Ahrensia sp. R2A130]
MTPFGEYLRRLRRERGVTQQDMAEAIGVSQAYLSALEHGKRGQPSWPLLQSITGYFNIIWDEAEALQQAAALSHPKVTVDTSEASPKATLVANRMARELGELSDKQLDAVLAVLDE